MEQSEVSDERGSENYHAILGKQMRPQQATSADRSDFQKKLLQEILMLTIKRFNGLQINQIQFLISNALSVRYSEKVMEYFMKRGNFTDFLFRILIGTCLLHNSIKKTQLS